MARPPRLELPGVPLHIIQRGNNRADCFFSDIDRRFYLKCLADAAARRHCAIHAYVLMSNHVHLLVTPHAHRAAAAMLQDIGRKYVRVINTIRGRSGTLWEGRFKSCLVDSEEYLLTCHRYIELNPVRAGMVTHPASYEWSSHAHYAFGSRRDFISEHPLIAGLGDGVRDRQAAFRRLFSEDLGADTLDRIRSATQTCTALGSDRFLKEMSLRLGRPVAPAKRGRPAKPAEQPRDDPPVSGKLF